ncbi:MAG TPA: LON peptidase substrate-binding domain-containing protein [Polyangiaceae bacterium]|nr:LON peptidase substrate-binding domain-containing protein [Polyangiaceae bacterium]
MSEQDYQPGQVIEELPLFPLPAAVLFPGMLLPLHVFELRYRAMTEHVLAGTKQMAVVLLTSGPSDDAGQPAIAQVAGMGEVVQHHALSDGRFNIVLRGMARVQLQELPFTGPFRRARAVVLPSHEGNVGDGDLVSLVYSATRFAAQLRSRDSQFELQLPDVHDPAATVDACAHQLIIESDERQQILETLHVGNRVRRCVEVLAVQAALLQAHAGMLS